MVTAIVVVVVLVLAVLVIPWFGARMQDVASQAPVAPNPMSVFDEIFHPSTRDAADAQAEEREAKAPADQGDDDPPRPVIRIRLPDRPR